MTFGQGRRSPPLAASVAVGLFVALMCFGHRAEGQAQTLDDLIRIEKASAFCNGTVSLNHQCNVTVFSYPAGCPSGVPQTECTEPTQGKTCVELPEFNATCLSDIFCTEFEFPANSFRMNDEWPSFGQALDIACETGYERSDGMGFATKAYCQDTGNFTAMDAPDFECVRLSCGRYCRYCRGAATRWTSDPKIVMQHRDENGEDCCLVRPDPLFDNSDDGRNNPFVANGRVLEPWIVRYEETIQIECDEGYDAVPAWGFLQPKCIPRDDCSWAPPEDPTTDNGWNAACRYVRGRYETGAVCKRILTNISFSYFSNPTVPCASGAKECEFPENVQITLHEGEPGVQVFWSFENDETSGIDMPIRPPTGLEVSTLSGVGSMWVGEPIRIDSSKAGCNVITQFRTINAVATKEGRPNSIVSISPLIKVTATNGKMPANMSRCTGVFPAPQTDSRNNILLPNQMWGGCLAYRFFAFVPVALADTQADAMALSELTFRFKGRVVEGGVASTAGVCPAAESPRYLMDRDPTSKMLTLTNCWVLIDFDRAVAVDTFEVATSNDCTSRDPVRWMILGSADAQRWALINDQTSGSFQMPLVRNAYAQEQLLPLVIPHPTRGKFQNVTVLDTTKVGNALNRVRVMIEIVDENDVLVAPPIGTRFVLGGLESRRTAADDHFPIHSKYLGPPEHEAPGVQPDGQWFQDDDRLWKVEFVVGQCLPREPLTVSFLFTNPAVFDPTLRRPQRQLSAEAHDSMEIEPWTQQQDVLRGGQTVQVTRMTAQESTKVAGKFNTISVKYYFTAPPMTGTELIIDKLLGSMSPSDPELPVMWELEDGQRVLGVGNFDAVMGRLVTLMPVDSVQVCSQDGTCGTGNTVTVVFQIYNPPALQEPWTLESYVNFCPLPAEYGCLPAEVQVVGPVLSDGDVLGGVQACVEPSRVDNCSVCDGDNTLCMGCDGKVPSNKELDLCGVCGGENECVGCDGVVNSGLAVDRCGVCNGTNECEVVVDVNQVVDWPHIALNLTIINAPGRTAITDAEVFSIKESIANLLDFVPAAIDVLSVSDAPEGKALVEIRRHLHPDHIAIYAKRRREVGESVCTIAKAEKFGCEVNEGPEAFELIVMPSSSLRRSSTPPDVRSDAPVPALHRRLMQTGGNPPPTGVIDVWLRLNFGKDSETLEKAVALEEAILSDALSQELTRNELCNASGQPCRALLFDNITIFLENPLELDEPPPPPPESDLMTVVIVMCSIVGALLLCCLVLASRWYAAKKERQGVMGTKLEDLMDAADRGKAEVLKNAPPSEFVPPPQFNYMTQKQLVPAGEDDKVDKGAAGKAWAKQSSFKRNRRKWLTGGREGSSEMLPSSHDGSSPIGGSRIASREASGEVAGYITQGDWPPKREEPPSQANFSKSIRVKNKVLGPRDREALFAQAFPEDARKIGVQAVDGEDIFEELVDDEISPGRHSSPGRGVPFGSAMGSQTGSHAPTLSKEGSIKGSMHSGERQAMSDTGAGSGSYTSGHGKANGNGNGNGNGHGKSNGNGKQSGGVKFTSFNLNGNGNGNGNGKHEPEGLVEHDVAL